MGSNASDTAASSDKSQPAASRPAVTVRRPRVSAVANVVQIATPITLLAVWLAKVARSRSTEPGVGVAARLLGLLALLLPARDRERFVAEVLADIADLRWRQRVEELLSVAGAVPGLAVILRWARRRA
jgi:hypothetical protein